EHGEDCPLVVIVRLNFGNVRALTGHVVDDGIGQAAMIGPNGGDGGLHVVSGGGGRCRGAADASNRLSGFQPTTDDGLLTKLCEAVEHLSAEGLHSRQL